MITRAVAFSARVELVEKGRIVLAEEAPRRGDPPFVLADLIPAAGARAVLVTLVFDVLPDPDFPEPR